MVMTSENNTVRLVKIQHEERVATISELNLASRPVTGCSEARGKGAAAQVKGLSRELFIVPEVVVVHVTEGSTLIADRPTWTGQGDESPVGSETMAQYQMGDTPSIPGDGLAKHSGRTFLTSRKLRRKMKEIFNRFLSFNPLPTAITPLGGVL